MKVRELINQLKELDPNMDLVISEYVMFDSEAYERVSDLDIEYINIKCWNESNIVCIKVMSDE